MANDFKGVQAVGVTSATTVYTAPATSDGAPANKDSIILELDVSNTTTSAASASVEVLDSSAGTDAFIVKEAPIPVGGAFTYKFYKNIMPYYPLTKWCIKNLGWKIFFRNIDHFLRLSFDGLFLQIVSTYKNMKT